VRVQAFHRFLNWQDGDHVRLVFHAFKPFRNVEAEATPIYSFDERQDGVYDYEAKRNKGAYAPDRRQMLKLSKSEVLITVA
jgi:hypothetical protein